MINIKVCLAIGDKKIEDWFLDKIDAEFTSMALHTGMVLDILKNEKPDILIIREQLPNSGGNGKMSLGLLIKKIRQEYTGCRIIIVADSHKIGDDFLRTMVSMGIYDIVYGETINASLVVDMVYNPKTYSYGQELQGLSDEEFNNLDSDNNAVPSKLVEAIPNENYREKKTRRKAQQEEIKQPKENTNNQYVDTIKPVYSSNMDNFFLGIVFEYIEEEQTKQQPTNETAILYKESNDDNNDKQIIEDVNKSSDNNTVYAQNIPSQQQPATSYEVGVWGNSAFSKKGKILLLREEMVLELLQ